MKYSFTFLFLLTLIHVSAQPMFRKTYGFGIVNEGKCVIQTFDNGYAIAGSTTPQWGGQTDAYLIKTDSVGNALFQYSYGSIGIDKATCILQLADSGYLLAGYSNGFGSNNDYDVLLVRVDKNGTQQWINTFGTNDWDFINDMRFTPDGNCVLAGVSYGSGSGTSSGYVVKIDLSGNVLWQKFISRNTEVTLNRITVKPDGSLTTCGKLEDISSGATDGFVMFMDPNGDTLHSSVVDQFGRDECFNAIGYFSNGDIALAGVSDTLGNVDELIFRMDTAGNEIWSGIAIQSGQDIVNDLFIMNDTLVTGGSTSTSGQGHDDFHIVLYNEFGYWITGQANTYGGSENEFCYSLLLSNDGGYVMAGTSTSYGPGQQSVFFVKSDRLFTFDPNVSINIDEIQNSSSNVYPNPSNGKIRISSSTNEIGATLYLTDISGKLLYKKTDALPTTIEIKEQGIYFLRIETGTYSEFKKIIVTR